MSAQATESSHFTLSEPDHRRGRPGAGDFKIHEHPGPRAIVQNHQNVLPFQAQGPTPALLWAGDLGNRARLA
jgi:hypothetical protein